MKAFGIEIRKQGKVYELYNDVDLVLKQSKFIQVQRLTVAHALQRMFQVDRYLDICCIKECCKVCSVFIPSERMDIYSTLHCVHWNEMLPEFRQTVIAMLLDDFKEVLNPVHI